jgi:dolichol-phosphate mannosyltransferase
VDALSESLAIVMPVWNEAAVIAEVVAELERDVVTRLPDGVTVIVVDDHSSDGSADVLDKLAAQRDWLEVVHAPENRGHGPSVRDGLERARGEWLFVLDSDGNIPAADFWRLWDARAGADLVLGVRVDRRDARHRLLLTRAVRFVVTRLAGRPIKDPNVPFRLLRRELWHELAPLIGPDVLAPSILVSLGAAVRGRRVVEVPVVHRPRPGDVSSLRRVRLLGFSARGLVQLVRFRLRLGRARQ